jgi:hypothetical protein
MANPKPVLLGGGNYSISYDDRLTDSNVQSVTRHDYKVHSHYGRDDLAKPPPLGEIMHQDERTAERASETVSEIHIR